MSKETLEKNVLEWIATRPDEVVFSPKDGYFSFEMLVDAFEKGQEKGKDTFKSDTQEVLRKKFLNNATNAIESLEKLISKLLTKSIEPTKFFLNNSLSGASLLVGIGRDVYLDEALINFCYESVTNIEDESFKAGFHLSLNYIDDLNELDFDFLKADGYTFAFNLIDGSKIY